MLVKNEGDNHEEEDQTHEHQHHVQPDPHVVYHQDLRVPPLSVDQRKSVA